MVNEFRAAPPEVWDVAIYGKYRSAYDAVGMKPILPAPDYMELSDGIAQMLHDLGEKCSPIQPSDAALPVFEVSMMESNPTDSVQSDLWNVANAAHTTDDELFIYGWTSCSHVTTQQLYASLVPIIVIMQAAGMKNWAPFCYSLKMLGLVQFLSQWKISAGWNSTIMKALQESLNGLLIFGEVSNTACFIAQKPFICVMFVFQEKALKVQKRLKCRMHALSKYSV